MAVEEDEEMTRSGIPIRLIWVPYLVLTLIILSLMIASFVRFHIKHGHKYLRRREELMLRHNQAAAAAQAAARGENKPPPNGGPTLTLSPNNPTGVPPHSAQQTASSSSTTTNNHHSTINHHRHLPREPPGIHTTGGPRGLPPPHKVVSSSSSKVALHHPHHALPRSASAAAANKKTLASTGPRHARRNRPIAFTRNANGSMVDLRVAGVDSVTMFKSSFCPARPQLPPIHWADRGARPPPYRTLHSPGSGFSDEDDDHVLLIHQSKV